MFSDAFQKVSSYTRPVVTSIRMHDGTVFSDVATFIVLNEDGWIMTAGHVFDHYTKYQTDTNKMKEIEELNESRVAAGEPDHIIKPDEKSIVNHSFWWGWDGVHLVQAYVDRQLDIAVGKLEPFNPSWVHDYPVIIDPSKARPGTSLCRLGYPFVDVSPSWDSNLNSFRISKIPAKEALFPNEGIHTRTIKHGRCKNGNYDWVEVETSTPGMRGQSGGPIFDKEGRLYAMQTKTHHMPLGFRPVVEYQGQNVVENQFLNVGIGLHASTIIQLLDGRGVRYTLEGDETGYRIVG